MQCYDCMSYLRMLSRTEKDGVVEEVWWCDKCKKEYRYDYERNIAKAN